MCCLLSKFIAWQSSSCAHTHTSNCFTTVNCVPALNSRWINVRKRNWTHRFAIRIMEHEEWARCDKNYTYVCVRAVHSQFPHSLNYGKFKRIILAKAFVKGNVCFQNLNNLHAHARTQITLNILSMMTTTTTMTMVGVATMSGRCSIVIWIYQ